MELITRVKALLRRTETSEPKLLQLGNLMIDHERHLVFVDDKQLELTFKEYELLRYLMTNPSVVLSREAIMRQVWGVEFEGESRTVDMHIKTLRQKLGRGRKQDPYRAECGLCDRLTGTEKTKAWRKGFMKQKINLRLLGIAMLAVIVTHAQCHADLLPGLPEAGAQRPAHRSRGAESHRIFPA